MKIKRNYIFLLSGLILLFISLAAYFIFFRKNHQEKKALAKVNEQYLYASDLNGLILPGTTTADSADIVNRYIESWLRKQTLITRAHDEGGYNEKEIDQKILNYKNELIVYEFEKNYVKLKLDTIISEDEIVNYYNNNLSNFELRQSIVRSWLIKLPANSPKLNDIKQAVALGKDKEKVESYCSQFALDYSLEDSVWKDADQLIKGTPFQENQNKLQFLQQNKFSEISLNDAVYLLKIFEFKSAGQVSPLNFVKTQVKDIIVNKRKVALTQKLEKDVYEQAKQEKKIEVYVK